MQLSRRSLLASLAIAPLAACSSPRGSGSPSSHTPSATSPAPSTWPNRPGDPLAIDAVIFDGAFGVDYISYAADALRALYPSVTTQVSPVQRVNESLRARFDEGGTPPDLIDNSGSDPLPVAEMVASFLPLDDVVEATNPQGQVISETLFFDALNPGIVNDKLLSINYAMTVYGLWYSASTFAAAGWPVPTTWDELLALGETVKAADQYLFVWGDDAVTYYQELAITSAIKEGGHEVRVALDNLAEGSWSHPAVTAVLQQLEACVEAGLFLYGGPYLEAQQLWSKERRALFYPSGAWIVRETLDSIAAGFELTAAPVPTVSGSPTLPQSAIHSTATESFLVPAKAKNPDGGKSLLQALLSPAVAREFSRANLVPTIVRDSIPTDLESSALTSQTRMLSDAGEHVFSWRFPDYYALNASQEVLWAQFLRGELTSALLAAGLQKLSDAVRNDPTVERYTAS